METAKKLFIYGGKFAIVDKYNYNFLNTFKWSLHSGGYVHARYDKKWIYLHHIVKGFPINDLQIDHINRNKLDNRYKNLRIVTHAINQLNRGLQRNNTSGYPGVDKFGNKWRVRIKRNTKEKHIGYFTTLKDAIIARQKELK